MKILIPTIGSRGDVQPFIALAQGLDHAGHNTVLASHPLMRSLIESHNVTFAPMGGEIDLAHEIAEIRRQSRNVVLSLIQVMRFGFKMLEQTHSEILALCQDTDLVVVPAAIAAGKNEAEISGLPYLSVSLMPWAVPYDDPKRSLPKRALYKGLDGLIRLITTRPLNAIRTRQGLPPVGIEGFTSARLNLIPVSPTVYPPNPLWRHQHKLVGYWFADPPHKWEPPADLSAFLEKGDPPFVVSLGAMSLGDYDAEESVSLFVEAVQRTGTRAIIQGWEAVVKRLTLPSCIHASGSVPHSWLLPQCNGIIHHGGFGTTAAGLRAGIPALVIPHVVDQFFWGQRVFELGAGPKPIPRTKLDADKLSESLSQLMHDGNMKTTAAKLGKQICSEHGVAAAVRWIEETFA
jgi:sterol 3beta-glucosyltransferase